MAGVGWGWGGGVGKGTMKEVSFREGECFSLTAEVPYPERKSCGKKISFFKPFAPTVPNCSSIEQKRGTRVLKIQLNTLKLNIK